MPINPHMETLTTGMIFVFLAAGGITAFAMLSVFANAIGHETQLHDLRNRVKELHYQQAMHLAKVSGQITEEGEVEILDDDDKVIEATEIIDQLSTQATEPQEPNAQSLPEPTAAPEPIAA